MYFAKIAVIMYIFSISMLFGAYYMNQVFHDPILGGNDNITFNAIDTLVGNHSINPPNNADLIFGDFRAAYTLFFGIVTGSTIDNAFHLIPFVDVSILLLQGLLFDVACVFLAIYIISGRSI